MDVSNVGSINNSKIVSIVEIENSVTSGDSFSSIMNDAEKPNKGLSVPNITTANSNPASLNAQNNTENLLTSTETDAVRARPTMREFMTLTGSSSTIAAEILYGVIGSNADLRNWEKIMNSDRLIAPERLGLHGHTSTQEAKKKEGGSDRFHVGSS